MASDLFAAVRAAEEKADHAVKEAQQAAREQLKQSEAVCVEKERTAAREQRVLYQSLLDDKRKEMQKTLDEEADGRSRQMDANMQKARERLPEAVKFIAERVMSDGNR